jgi:two-component system NarL family sensor kinase
MDFTIPVIIIVGSVILVLLANFIIVMLFAYQKRYNNHIQEINTIKEQFEREILKMQLEIKEQTMHNISQEIHDNIGQMLSLANLQLTAVELPDDPFTTSRIERSMELVSKVITDLRDLSKTLSPEDLLRRGLSAAISFDLDLMQRPKVLATEFRLTGDEQRLDASKEIVVYRIVQQALNNVLKHAEASSVQVSLNYSLESLSVSIQDDGRGFDTAIITSKDNQGAGVRNMIHRAELIQASIRVESLQNRGTRIILSLPLS